MEEHMMALSPQSSSLLDAILASDESRDCTGAEFVVDGGVIAGHSPHGLEL